MLDHQITDLDAYLDGSTWMDPETGEVHPLTPELFIERSKFVFAKTMKHMPHEYTVRDLDTPDGRRSTCLSHETFEWFVRYIRARGYPGYFGKQRYMYFNVDGWRYWSMGAPADKTTILNRARLEDEKIDPVFSERLLPRKEATS
jgi:hypothetical protein